MKKSLLALAILGAFAGAASAQSSVTIYGKVDVGVDSINGINKVTNRNDRTLGLDSGNGSASRIGFKGVEDLGNGLKAMFVLENGFNADNGTGKTAQPFSRLSYLGLKGAFGTVKLGKMNTQLKDMVGQIDPFGATGIVNGVDFMNGGGLDQRLGNTISYYTPNFSGFSGGLGYTFGEASGDNTANRGYSARVGYKNGPLNVQFAYQDANTTDTTVNPYVDQKDTKNTMLGATYDFGVVKLHAIYGEKKVDTNTAPTSSNKTKSGTLGVTVPFGASKIRAEYIRNTNDAANSDNHVWAASYTYDLSKRTQFYTTYVGVNNDSQSNLGIGGPGNSVKGENADGFAVGVIHKF